jgi:hypothetical protein
VPRPSRSGTVLQPAFAALAVAALLGGLLVASVGAAALVARAEIPGCERPGEEAAAREGSGAPAVTGGLVGVEVGACAEEPEEPVPDTDSTPPPGAITVDGRTFTREDRPFFWLGDTAWSLFVNLTRSETVDYLDTRADQGFTVIQAVAIFPQAGGPGPNQYGDSPYGTDLDDLAVTDGADYADDEQYDYWDHVDFAVEQAAERGLVMAILPVWADGQVGELVTEDNAAAYGRFLGRRYGDRPNVVWVLGGDAPADGTEDVWDALAGGIRAGGGHQLTTYHPRGDQTSATWFDGADWIGFHMLQGGHCLRHDVRADLVEDTYEAGLPFVDGEPIYEDHPYCWRPEAGFSTALDVRRDACWSVLGGAAGHTYGHHAVWQFLADGRSPELGARGSWTDALTSPGAEQMQNVRALVESRPRVEPSADAVTDAGSGAERIQAAVAEDGSTVMAYTPAGRDVTVDLDVLSGRTAQPWWFDPRTGDATRLDPVRSSGTRTFAPPAGEGDEVDWVLVVDDAAADLAAPGTGRGLRAETDGPAAAPAPTAEPAPDAGAGSGDSDASGQHEEPDAAPRPEPAPEAAPAAPANTVWDRLAQCESSGKWGIDTGNGYHGGLQFDSSTWRDYGGTEFAPEANLATREQQIRVAERVRDDRGGYGAWPACAGRLGLPRRSRWSW